MRRNISGKFAQRALRGMSLVELLIAMVIGMFVSLAIFGVLAASEGRKRTTTSVSDINQAGSYAMYAMDKLIRNAGAGFSYGVTTNPYGCPIFAQNGGGQILPRSSGLPAPFATVNTGAANRFGLYPLLVIPNGTTSSMSGQPSDALVVMSGNSGTSTVPVPFIGTTGPTSASVSLQYSQGISANDILLLTDQQTPGSSDPLLSCMITQVSAVNGTLVSLAGTYYSPTIGSASLTAMTAKGTAIDLGNIVGGNAPSFNVIGVGDSNILYSYDLLQTTNTPLTALAEGVFEMYALYGVDTSNPADNIIDTWVSPRTTTGEFAWSSLTAGTDAAALSLAKIQAVRIGLIMRTSLPEKTVVAPASLTVFSGFTDASSASLAITRTLSGTEQNYRYRVVESTIPLRNLGMSRKATP